MEKESDLPKDTELVGSKIGKEAQAWDSSAPPHSLRASVLAFDV